MKKKIWFTGSVVSLVSSVAGVGYRRAVNATANPSGLQEIKVVYETLGGAVAFSLIVPVVVLLVYGRFLGMWKRDEYWNLAVAVTMVSMFMIVLFPFLLRFS